MFNFACLGRKGTVVYIYLMLCGQLLQLLGQKLTQSRYLETINLIYSTNTIHIRSISLIYNIHSLFLPQRLGAITSLELAWLLHRHSRSEVGEYPRSSLLGSHWSLYHALMRNVSHAFPSLKKFYISIQSTSFGYEPPTESVEIYERRLLEPTDAMVRTQGSRLRDCQIAPNASLYCALERRAEMDGAHVEQGSGTTTTGAAAYYWPRFWRPVIVRPVPDDRTPEQVGYWVRRGKP